MLQPKLAFGQKGHPPATRKSLSPGAMPELASCKGAGECEALPVPAPPPQGPAPGTRRHFVNTTQSGRQGGLSCPLRAPPYVRSPSQGAAVPLPSLVFPTVSADGSSVCEPSLCFLWLNLQEGNLLPFAFQPQPPVVLAEEMLAGTITVSTQKDHSAHAEKVRAHRGSGLPVSIARNKWPEKRNAGPRAKDLLAAVIY